MSATPPFYNARLLARFLDTIILLCIMFAVIVSDGSVEPRAYVGGYGFGGYAGLSED